MQIAADSVVLIHYTLKDDDGKVLDSSAGGEPLACARSGDWRHPVVGLWPVRLREDLRHALVVEDLRKIEIWTARHGIVTVAWPTEPIDPFFNVNTPEDAARAEQIAALEAKS